MVWDKQVRPAGWTPWANTLAYYKFDWNLNDSSWNSRNLSMYTWTFTYWTTSWWAKYIQTSSSNAANNLTLPLNWDSYTVQWYVNFWEFRQTGSQQAILMDFVWNSWWARFWSWWWWFQPVCNVWSDVWLSWSINTWYLFTVVIKNHYIYWYVNWELKRSWAMTQYSWTSWTLVINWIADKSSTWYRWAWKLSELIFESRDWTQSEIQDYYNQTKWNYWL